MLMSPRPLHLPPEKVESLQAATAPPPLLLQGSSTRDADDGLAEAPSQKKQLVGAASPVGEASPAPDEQTPKGASMPTSRSRRKKRETPAKLFLSELSEEEQDQKRGEFERKVKGHNVEKKDPAEEKESNAAQQSTAGRGRGGRGSKFSGRGRGHGRGGRG